MRRHADYGCCCTGVADNEMEPHLQVGLLSHPSTRLRSPACSGSVGTDQHVLRTMGYRSSNGHGHAAKHTQLAQFRSARRKDATYTVLNRPTQLLQMSVAIDRLSSQ